MKHFRGCIEMSTTKASEDDFVRFDGWLRKGLPSMLRNAYSNMLHREARWLYRRQVRRSIKSSNFDRIASTMVSRSLSNDIFVLNIFILGVFWFHAGVFFFFRFMFSSSIAAVLLFLFPGLRPDQLDQRIRASARSIFGGLFCIETWLTVAICGAALIDSGVHAMYNDANHYINHALLVCGLVIFTVLVMWTRIWSSARFPHSVVLGFCGGIASVYVAGRLEQMSKGRALRGSAVRLTLTVLPTVAFICAVMFFIAIKAEQNTLYGFSIEKKEYIRVLNNIINEESSIDDSTAGSTPAQAAAARRRLLRQRGLRGKKDSFVQLMTNMERRSREANAIESRRNVDSLTQPII